MEARRGLSVSLPGVREPISLTSMSISFSQLRFAEPSPEARRLLWHVLSIGSVSRDEPERHDGLDKAGLFLFRVVAGTGSLEMRGNQYRLTRGQNCWLVDLRHPRIYLPDAGKTLRTEGVRFSGPGVEAWLELLGADPVFTLPPGVLRLRLGRWQSLVQKRPPQYEWAVHSELDRLVGRITSRAGRFHHAQGRRAAAGGAGGGCGFRRSGP